MYRGTGVRAHDHVNGRKMIKILRLPLQDHTQDCHLVLGTFVYCVIYYIRPREIPLVQSPVAMHK